MKKKVLTSKEIEAFWHHWYTEGPPDEKTRQKRFFRLVPAQRRCKFCLAPFDGIGGVLSRRLLSIYPSRFNPHYCNVCDEFAKTYQGAAVVPITILFADVRGSTTLAETMDPQSFGEIINHFYIHSTEILSKSGAMIEKLAGDEVTALFTRGTSGPNYTRKALIAANLLMRSFGPAAKSGINLSLGIGIHSGEARVGAVGRPDGNVEVTALGDVPNVGSRLTGQAKAGEILVSAATLLKAGFDLADWKLDYYELKGHKKPIRAAQVPLSFSMPEKDR